MTDETTTAEQRVNQFLGFAEDKGIDPRVVEFLMHQPLELAERSDLSNFLPTLESVNRMENLVKEHEFRKFADENGIDPGVVEFLMETTTQKNQANDNTA